MKKFMLLLVTLSLVLSVFSLPTFAAEPTPAKSQSTIDTKATETIWVTRTYNGKLQKRLWSVTYEIWLTDWIDVE